MARSRVYRTGRSQAAFNMTPMIDCTFQLLIFFMLTTQMASADFIAMDVPKPDVSQARKFEEGERVIVNIVPYSKTALKDRLLLGLAREYRLGTYVVAKGDTGSLVRELLNAQRKSRNPEKFVVEIRADSGIRYSEIEPVLQALQQAELARMHITARPEGSR